eukprot:2400785-Prymnesium_polylepis.1
MAGSWGYEFPGDQIPVPTFHGGGARSLYLFVRGRDRLARDFGCDCFSAPDQRKRRILSSSRAPLCVIAVGSLGVVHVRAIRVSDRNAIDGGPRDDRSRRVVPWKDR